MRQEINYQQKIANFEEDSYLGLTQKWREEKLRVVFTNGCFDILHAGHVDYLAQAAERGDRLVIGLNSDVSVRGLKGPKRPVNTWDHRALLLAGLGFVDLVIPFDEETPLDLIQKIKPQVLIKGNDYRVEDIVGFKEVSQLGGEVVTIPFQHDISSSQIIDKIKNL